MASNAVPVPLGVSGAVHDTLNTQTDRPNTTGLPTKNPTTPFWQTELLGTGYPAYNEGSEGALTSDADICIVGSGITGVSTAYHLARHFAKHETPSKPVKIIILDAREFCNGATGRNGGHLTASGYDSFLSREAKYGHDDALRQVFLEEYTVTEILKLIKESNLEEAVDLVSGGLVWLFFSEEEELEAKAHVTAAANAGIDVKNVEWLTKEQAAKEYGAAYPGVRIPGNNLWPRKLVSAIYTLAQQTTPNVEVSVHTLTPVTSISPARGVEGRRWNVSTPRGAVTSSYVLHATNAYVSHLLPHLHGPEGVVPGRGQIIATRAAVDLPKSAFAANEGFEYWFPRPVRNPGERPLVILGGGREIGEQYELYETDDSKVNDTISRAMRKFLPSVFPGKFEEGREPEMEWSGIMGFTKTGDPFVGPVIDPSDNTGDSYEGQYVCAGFSGHGMPRVFACAEAVAGIIASDMTGQQWTPPSWLPLHYLTRKY